jgi:hypothetical protein
VKRSWNLFNPGHAYPLLASVAWSPDGHQLVLGVQGGNFSGIEILDTDEAMGPDNPRDVGPASEDGLPGGRYANPLMRPDGVIIALAPYCWGGMGCPNAINGTSVVGIDAATGSVVSTLLDQPDADEAVGINAMILDPSGTQLAVLGAGADTGNLYSLRDGALHLVARGVPDAAWLLNVQ